MKCVVIKKALTTASIARLRALTARVMSVASSKSLCRCPVPRRAAPKSACTGFVRIFHRALDYTARLTELRPAPSIAPGTLPPSAAVHFLDVGSRQLTTREDTGEGHDVLHGSSSCLASRFLVVVGGDGVPLRVQDSRAIRIQLHGANGEELHDARYVPLPHVHNSHPDSSGHGQRLSSS